LVATVRWFSVFWKYNILIHTIVGNVIMGVTYYYCIRALTKGKWVFNDFSFQFDNVHSVCGYILTLFIGFITVSGAVARYYQLWGEWNTYIIIVTRRIHKYLSLFLFVVSIVSNTSGWKQWDNYASNKYYYLPNGNIILSISIPVLCEVIYRWVRDYKKVKVEMKLKNGKAIIMTEEEFEERIS